jgi:hypothetical protein
VSPGAISVRVGGSEVKCQCAPSVRDQIAGLIAGSTVEVTGTATVDREDRVLRIDHVHEILTVDLEPVRVARFEYQGTRYCLTRPVIVDVEYADSLWVYRNEQLNLWGHGTRREDAMRDLNANFAFLWREYAEESDDVLDDAARALKQRLLALSKDDAAKAG